MQEDLKEEEMRYLRGDEQLDEDEVDAERIRADDDVGGPEGANQFNRTGMNFNKRQRPGEGHDKR